MQFDLKVNVSLEEKKNSIELCLLPKSGIKQRFFSSVDFSLYVHQFEHFIFGFALFSHILVQCVPLNLMWNPHPPLWLGMYKKILLFKLFDLE